MTHHQSLFTPEDIDHANSCVVCRWNNSSMCPYNDYFVGRTLMARKYVDRRVGCHRFAVTEEEREKRELSLMQKLSKIY